MMKCFQTICLVLLGFLVPGGILILVFKAQELMPRKPHTQDKHKEGSRLNSCIALFRHRL